MTATSVIGVHDTGPIAEPSAAWWLTVAFIAFWVGLLAHEAAHYGVGRLVFTSDEWTTTTFNVRRAAGSAAGPAITLIVVAACAVLSGAAGRLRWVAVAAAVGAASRLALIAMPTMLGKSNDENVVGLAMGISPKMLWAVEAVVTVLLMTVIARRSGVSRHAILLSVGAALVGWISAFTFGRAVGLPI
jgi:uncharacterized membrane protein